jgi:hypothetical protein
MFDPIFEGGEFVLRKTTAAGMRSYMLCAVPTSDGGASFELPRVRAPALNVRFQEAPLQPSTSALGAERTLDGPPPKTKER